MRSSSDSVAIGLTVMLVVSCGQRPIDVTAEPGRPLPELPDAEAGRFLLGRAVFERLIVPDEGLGPLFNADRCSACHDTPAAGGFGTLTVSKATRYDGGTCDLLEGEGGDNIQQRATAALAAHGITGETVPVRANARSTVTSPPLFGLGLIEAIPDDELLSRNDPDDADGDGISGRATRDAEGRVGRFGRKAEFATIAGFTDTALRFEVGLTTPAHPREETVNGRPLPADADPMPEPEIDANGIALLTDFIRLLAPPAREIMSGATADTVREGEKLFQRLRCVSCHSPEMRTGPGGVRAFDRVRVPLYSDLLLHDMGGGLSGECGPQASPTEWRTPPLWGLRYRSRLLHDGRATGVRDAVLAHGGEAAISRDAFATLRPADQMAVIRFLASL